MLNWQNRNPCSNKLPEKELTPNPMLNFKLRVDKEEEVRELRKKRRKRKKD